MADALDEGGMSYRSRWRSQPSCGARSGPSSQLAEFDPSCDRRVVAAVLRSQCEEVSAQPYLRAAVVAGVDRLISSRAP